MKIVLLLIQLVSLLGCSIFNGSPKEENPYPVLDRDYIDQLSYLGKEYLSSDQITTINLNRDSIAFLTSAHDRLVANNEMLFHGSKLPKFYIIKNQTPFIFSLPDESFYISTGLISKHLKSEELFMAAFSSEVIKSQRSIYEKRLLIPLGFITTEKMLQVTRVKFEIKTLINEWSYSVLKRAGFDATTYLNWIQVQNRNSLDFSLYIGDTGAINHEEQSFKSFLTKQGVASLERKINEANSSKAYYKLIKNIEEEMDETRTIRKNSRRRTI